MGSCPATQAAEAVKKAPPSLNPFAGLSDQERVVLLAPITVYAIFYAARSVNPKVQIGDVLFGLLFVAVVVNIISILAFKVRLF